MSYPSKSILLNMHPQRAMYFINSRVLISDSHQWKSETFKALGTLQVWWYLPWGMTLYAGMMMAHCLCALGYPGSDKRGAVGMALHWGHMANLWQGWLATMFLYFTPLCSHVFIPLGLERLNGSQTCLFAAVLASFSQC